MDNDTLIKVEDLCKIYNPGENEVRALDHVSLEIKKGELVAIIGQSGSGKSTFMNMLGCLDVPVFLSYLCDLFEVLCCQCSTDTGKTQGKVVFLFLAHETAFF